jgi:hypothetical protein
MRQGEKDARAAGWGDRERIRKERSGAEKGKKKKKKKMPR